MSRHFFLALSVAFLTGCGGGGSSSPAPTQPPVVQPPVTPSNSVMVFSPSSVTANYKAGNSTTVTLNAKIISNELLSSETFPYLYIVDSNKVLASNVIVTQIDDTNFSLSFKKSATLAKVSLQRHIPNSTV